MFQQLFKSLTDRLPFTEAELELTKTYFIPKKLRRRQYLLQEGDVCRYNAFVEKGIMRSYTVDEKGTEHIFEFAFEGWWISDLASFLSGQPSRYNIDALEDAELLLLTDAAREALMDKLPVFERYQRLLLENAYIAQQSRITSSLTETAESRYIQLTGMCQDITQRIPQHMIASYLGLTPETLSRIRRQIGLRK